LIIIFNTKHPNNYALTPTILTASTIFFRFSVYEIMRKVTTRILFTFISYSSCFVFFQSAGEESVANLDKLRFSNGRTTVASLRLKMQKVLKCVYVDDYFKSSL